MKASLSTDAVRLALLCINMALVSLLCLRLLHHLYQPVAHIRRLAARLHPGQQGAQASLKESAEIFASLLDTTSILRADREALQASLRDAQQRITLLMQVQQGMCQNTLSGSAHLFGAVDAYAEYLEELVVSDLVDQHLRYDYDEVTEASHNLRFLIQGMSHLVQIETAARAIKLVPTDAALLLGQHLIHLTPALERRSMHVDSSRCAETLPIRSDETFIKHLLWALLTTCLHYAEEDSTLRIDSEARATGLYLHFSVTLSSPNTLSVHERAAYLASLSNSEDTHVHMFASAIQQHPNYQLASRLASHLCASTYCVALSEYCCQLSLHLPYDNPITCDE